jgi:hypothetical protein
METERIELSARERERLKVLQQVEEGHLQQVEAARRLRLSDRQVRRLQQRWRPGGRWGDCASAARPSFEPQDPRRGREARDNGTTTSPLCRVRSDAGPASTWRAPDWWHLTSLQSDIRKALIREPRTSRCSRRNLPLAQPSLD